MLIQMLDMAMKGGKSGFAGPEVNLHKSLLRYLQLLFAQRQRHHNHHAWQRKKTEALHVHHVMSVES